MVRIGIVGVMFALAVAVSQTADWPARAEPAVTGLDHVPIAVADLDAAAVHYRALGFTLKPGVAHGNGIRNQHAKFPDGTELELITAPSAVDALTSTYRRHLGRGDGPAFLALYAPAMNEVARRLTDARQPFRSSGAFIDVPDGDPLGYVFFGPRNRSPTDRPEHFQHPNTADALIAVWLAPDDPSREHRLLATLGATFTRAEASLPDRLTVEVAHLPEGEILLLPSSSQLVPGRPIVGVSLHVRNLDEARVTLARAAPRVRPVRDEPGRLVLPPAATHGLWIELRAR